MQWTRSRLNTRCSMGVPVRQAQIFPRWNRLWGCVLSAANGPLGAFFLSIFERIGRSNCCNHRLTSHNYGAIRDRTSQEGWLSPVEGTRLEIERGVKPTVGSNPTPSAASSLDVGRFPFFF